MTTWITHQGRNQFLNGDQIIAVYGSLNDIPSSHSQSSKPPSDSPFSVPKCINSFFDRLDKFFKLHERNPKCSNRRIRWMTELKAAFAIYVTMAYILPVNASILTQTGGICPRDTFDSYQTNSESVCSTSAEKLDGCLREFRLNLIAATAASICFSTLVMGLCANRPFVLAPGMGMNAYFVYTVVGTYSSSKEKLNYEAALFATFCEGCFFFILSCLGFTSRVGEWIPKHIKSSIAAGIGLFLTRIGFEKDQGIGLFVHNELMFGGDVILGIIGVIIMMILFVRRVRCSMLITIMIMTIISFIQCGENGIKYSHWYEYLFKCPQWSYFGDIPTRMFSKQYTFDNFEGNGLLDWVTAVITFLLVDVLDTTGALYGLADYAKILEDKKDLEKSIKYAYCADAFGTIVGSIFGVSPLTTFIESSSGIHQGGRTGITAIFVSMFFGLSIFLGPIFALIPRYATGPCLIIIGLINLKYYIGNINWSSLRIAFPSGLTLFVMPFSKSITYGIAAGVIADLVIKFFDGLHNLIIWRFGPCDDQCICCENIQNNKNKCHLISDSNTNSNLTDNQIICLFKTRILGMTIDNVLDIDRIKQDMLINKQEHEYPLIMPISLDTTNNNMRSELKQEHDQENESTTSVAMTKTKSSETQRSSVRIN